MCGNSGMVMARQPFAATRRTSSAISCGSQTGGMASGMNRSGYAAHHSSMCQSLYAWTVASARSLSCASWNMPPANPAKVGKHIDASTPLRFMSRTRSWMSYAPGRISANPTGSKPHSSLGHVTTAFRPIDPTAWPSNTHFSLPSSLISTCGTRSRYLAGA